MRVWFSWVVLNTEISAYSHSILLLECLRRQCQCWLGGNEHTNNISGDVRKQT